MQAFAFCSDERVRGVRVRVRMRMRMRVRVQSGSGNLSSATEFPARFEASGTLSFP